MPRRSIAFTNLPAMAPKATKTNKRVMAVVKKRTKFKLGEELHLIDRFLIRWVL